MGLTGYNGGGGSGGGGGVPTTVAFATVGNDGTLTAERAITAGTGITITDGGANSTLTWAAKLSTGVSGGQSAIGGTGASENLTLSSTSNGTKGKIILGAASAYDEANVRLGVGTASPSAALHVVGQAPATGALTTMLVVPGAATNQTLSTEIPAYDFDSTATRQWATGALTLQREHLIRRPTYAAVGPSTFTTAITSAVAAWPLQGTNVTITKSAAHAAQTDSVTVANAAGSIRTAYLVPSTTVTLTATTQMTASPSLTGARVEQITIAQSGGAVTVDEVAGGYFENPIGGASVTLTRAPALWGRQTTAQTATISDALILEHITSGTAANSFGVGLSMRAERASGAVIDVGRITTWFTNASTGTAAMEFATAVNGTMAVCWQMQGGSAPFLYGRQGTTYTAATIGALSLALQSGTSATVNSSAIVLNTTTVASGASATLKGIELPARTYTITGTTQITTANGFNVVEMAQPTYTDGSAVTVDNAASMALIGAPLQAGSAVITNGSTLQLGGAANIVNAAGTIRQHLRILDHTLTLTATTNMTGTPSITGINIGTITIAQSGGAVTVDAVAALYIKAAPAAGASVTLTRSYPLWVDAGDTRLDGNLLLGAVAAGANAANGVLALGNGATAPTTSVDLVQLYAVDISAGNASLGLFTEIAVVSETVVSDRTLTVKINGTDYKICLKA